MKILHGFSAIPPSERKEKPMEYLTTDMVTTVPEGTSPAKVDELPAGGGVPLNFAYVGSKFALEGFSESMKYELEGFGIKVILI